MKNKQFGAARVVGSRVLAKRWVGLLGAALAPTHHLVPSGPTAQPCQRSMLLNGEKVPKEQGRPWGGESRACGVQRWGFGGFSIDGNTGANKQHPQISGHQGG